MCHGAIESLKATPINKNTKPIISDGEIVEILIVSHGGNRNDTLVTVEKKM